MNEIYNNITDGALRRCSGDVEKADYLMNCTYFEYYWRLKGLNSYGEWMSEQMKKK